MMSQKERKASLEYFHISQFLKCYLKNEEYELKSKKTDPPDCVLHKKDQLISIEHTQLVKDEGKAFEQAQLKILRLAEREFRKQHNVDIQVYCTFEGSLKNTLKKDKRAEIAIKIAKLVTFGYENIQSKSSNYEYKDRKILGPELNSITISNLFSFSNWQSFGAYLVYGINHNWLFDRIEEKEKALPHYQNNFDENWLLFVTSFGESSSGLHADNLKQLKIKSRFNKIFIFEFRPEKITEFKIV